MIERRDSVRHKVDEECLITIRGRDVFGKIFDISESGISFVVENQTPFVEALRDYTSFDFESESMRGRCKVARVDTFNSLGSAMIGCRLIKFENKKEGSD